MRASELFALTPGDIEQKREVITITNGKGGKERRVLVKSETVKELFSYVSQKGFRKRGQTLPSEGPQLYNIIRKYGTLAGVTVHPHTLRHSFAINVVRHITDIRRVQLLLGHSS